LQKRFPLDLRVLRKAAKTVLAEMTPPDTEVSISIVDDARIQELNRRYLGRDRPTNVLAFSMKEGELPFPHPQVLGDVIISVDTARRQSNRFGLSEMETVVLLMIHGILHLLGFEHEGTKKGARQMVLKQKEFLMKSLAKEPKPPPAPPRARIA